MPFQSQAQRRYMYWAEKHGKLKKGTADTWEQHTHLINSLPERKKKK